MSACVYLKSEVSGKTTPDGRGVYSCDIHQYCTTIGEPSPFASCPQCADNLPLDRENFSSAFLDHLTILDGTRSRTHALRNLLSGRPSFLVCCGPSAKSLPLDCLDHRGIWSMAINNMAGFVRPSSFVCADPPSKFHHGIWLDPCVMKFVPIPKLGKGRSNLREKIGDEFRTLQIGGKDHSVGECPNVWAFSRRSWFIPDYTFFTDSDAAWGNHDSGTVRTGLEKTVCTMLLGIRLLYYLGSRRIYLVGADFVMDPSVGLKENYAFGEDRDADAIRSNNEQFFIVNKWLVGMQDSGVFAKFGLEIFNCFSQSGLRAFPYVPFDLAIDDVLSNFPEEPFDLSGWYIKR